MGQLAGLPSLLALPEWAKAVGYQYPSGPDNAAMERARREDAANVERLYSTKLVRISMGNHRYAIPANFLTPKGAQLADVLSYRYLGFVLFLPDYGGFTKENWREDWFHPQRIDVLEISRVDKTAMIPRSDGRIERIRPAGYGEPQAGFSNLKRLLEAQPSLRVADLAGYRRVNARSNKTVVWAGHRSNDEFFFFSSTSAPGEPLPVGSAYGLCDVRYYSEKEDLFIAYRYKQRHIERWRQIDDAIWGRIKAWRID